MAQCQKGPKKMPGARLALPLPPMFVRVHVVGIWITVLHGVCVRVRVCVRPNY